MSENYRAALLAVLGFSDFAEQVIQAQPDVIEAWAENGGPAALPGATSMAAELAHLLGEHPDEPTLMAELRRFRDRAMLAILWRDLQGQDDLSRVLANLSHLADASIDCAFEHAYRILTDRHGTPRNSGGDAQRLVVMGMGKLGGGELNFSSDVDLILAFPEAGQTDGRRPLSNEEFFARQGRLATRLLAERTAEGFVYRVDHRLRPFGDAGRLALSFTAMEQYYQREGRNWERYAWIKARPVAGDMDTGERLLRMLRPFIYRRYLDYSAFDALRDMKAMVRAEVARRNLDDDVKLGAGGIREVEFIAQAFQLIRGGRSPELRDRRLRTVLARLAEMGLLEADIVSELDAAYVFLRRLENRLQQVADAQTHELPEDPGCRERLANSLGFDRWTDLCGQLNQHRARVKEVFAGVFEAETDAAAGTDPSRWSQDWDQAWEQAWNLADGAGQLQTALQEAGFRDAKSAAEQLIGFRSGVTYRSLGQRARRRMDRFVPGLLATVDRSPNPDTALAAVMQIVRAVASRSAYVSLLSERPKVLERLVDLCGQSPWLTDLVARHPLLLDELLDRRFTHPDLNPESIGKTLASRLRSVDAGDLEAEMESLRFSRQSQAMALAAAVLDGRLDAASVAAALTALAEAVLEQTSRLAWRDLTARYGNPGGDPAGLALIAYGTLGGGELNFTSDLDLVFLHHGSPAGAVTDGERSIGNEAFYLRVTQRILHMLSTLTPSGRLYEVDVRLRPNGQSGFLVSAISAFAEYQLNEAWTWELQALTRARWVAGDDRLRTPFEDARRAALCQRQSLEALTADVTDMRAKMRAQLDRSNAERFDLKQGLGGKVDVEFIAQWARLRWCGEHPDLLDRRGTLESLDACGALGLMEAATVEPLLHAYRAYQQQSQELALAELPQMIPTDQLTEHRAQVTSAWQALLGNSLSP
jgi:glutamate-ammonia-ligase adenylyltransferase